MTTKVERDRLADLERFERAASLYDPPRPWTIQERGWSAKYPSLTYVTDGAGEVIGSLTCVWPTAMLKRIVRLVNDEQTEERVSRLGS